MAQLPRLALDVTACEVMKVLQLSDSAVVPISYLVPRKVNQPSCPHGRRWGLWLRWALFNPGLSCSPHRNFTKTCFQIVLEMSQQHLLRPGGLGTTRR